MFHLNLFEAFDDALELFELLVAKQFPTHRGIEMEQIPPLRAPYPQASSDSECARNGHDYQQIDPDLIFHKVCARCGKAEGEILADRGVRVVISKTSALGKTTSTKLNDLLLQGHINTIARRQFDWVERMGWHNKTVLEALALISSEVGEAVNECRGEKPTENFGEELADIILRTVDLAEMCGINIGDAILKKMEVNEQRGTRGRRI